MVWYGKCLKGKHDSRKFDSKSPTASKKIISQKRNRSSSSDNASDAEIEDIVNRKMDEKLARMSQSSPKNENSAVAASQPKQNSYQYPNNTATTVRNIPK